MLASWTATTGDSSNLFEMVLHTKGSGGLGGENTTGFSDPEIDREIQRASEEMRPELRSGLAFSPQLDMAVRAADVSLAP